MMTLDYVGDQEAMVHAQLGQQPLARTTETSLQPRQGTHSCLSAQPPALTFWTGTRPQVVTVSPSIVPFLNSKRTAAARSLVSLIEKRTFCGRFMCTSRGTTPYPSPIAVIVGPMDHTVSLTASSGVPNSTQQELFLWLFQQAGARGGPGLHGPPARRRGRVAGKGTQGPDLFS
jgi:hypothetical protein